jgi:hypothetical protein
MTAEISPQRAEILKLRARIVALERTAMAAIELTLLVRPDVLEKFLESRRRELEMGYLDVEFAPDLADSSERVFVAEEVERLMRALQSELNFPGGISAPENG